MATAATGDATEIDMKLVTVISATPDNERRHSVLNRRAFAVAFSVAVIVFIAPHSRSANAAPSQPVGSSSRAHL